MADAEALLLVYYYEPEVVEADAVGEDRVRADDNVAHALLQIPNCLGLLRL